LEPGACILASDLNLYEKLYLKFRPRDISDESSISLDSLESISVADKNDEQIEYSKPHQDLILQPYTDTNLQRLNTKATENPDSPLAIDAARRTLLNTVNAQVKFLANERFPQSNSVASHS